MNSCASTQVAKCTKARLWLRELMPCPCHATFKGLTHLEDFPPCLLVGDAHGDLPAEPAARPQRRVDRFEAAGRSDHEHALATAEASGQIATLCCEAGSVELVD